MFSILSAVLTIISSFNNYQKFFLIYVRIEMTVTHFILSFSVKIAGAAESHRPNCLQQLKVWDCHLSMVLFLLSKPWLNNNL